MKKVLFYVAAAACVAGTVLCGSCKKDEPAVITPVLEISSESVTLPAAGGGVTALVTGNQDWTATSSGAWCTVSPSSGKGDGKATTVTFTASATDAETARTATVTFKAGGLSKTVAVTQGAKFSWTLENGVLTIRGDESMPDYEYQGAPWYPQRASITSVVIETGVTSIGNSTFEYCIGLTSVTIPNSVISIGEYAFSNCHGLTSVTIPNSVTSIDRLAFGGCRSLISFTVESANSVYSSEGGVLFNKAKTELVTYPGGKQGAYAVPNSVTSIGNYAFYSCIGITSVTIPNSVTSIGNMAFFLCRDLTSVAIPNSVTSIGSAAFSECSSLSSITIPNSVTSGIVGNTFIGCNSLTSIIVNEAHSTYRSEDGVLFNKAKTELIVYPGGKQGAYTIPNSIKNIGLNAFCWCLGLTSVTIPNSITYISPGAFDNCRGLTEVHVSWATPISINGSSTFRDIPANAKLYVPAGTKAAYEASDWGGWFGGGVEEE